MARLIRYLEDGVWKYASVKDIGDLDLLKTLSKADLVSAINELYEKGGASEQDITDIQGRTEDLSGEMESVKSDLLNKANVEYVDGQLVKKIDTEQYEVDYTETQNALLDKVDMTKYTNEFNSTQTTLTQKAERLELQATQTELDSVKNNIVYKVEIISTNGLVFKNGIGSTTLEARVYHGSEDVTDTFNASAFKWTRISNDFEGDVLWNASHSGGTKTIPVTGSDVRVRATFNCELLDGSISTVTDGEEGTTTTATDGSGTTTTTASGNDTTTTTTYSS